MSPNNTPPGEKNAPQTAPSGPVFRKMTGDLVGVAILALGVGAFIAMIYLGYVRLYKPAQPGPAAVSEKEVPQADAQTTGKAEEICPNCGDKPQLNAGTELPKRGHLHIPSEAELVGSWETDFGVSQASFVIDKGAFQLIYIEGQTRRYTRGTYTYDPKTGLLTMMPQAEFGAPDPVPGVIYNVLTMREFTVKIDQDKKTSDIFWSPVGDGRTSLIHPLFLFTQTQDYAIGWSQSPG